VQRTGILFHTDATQAIGRVKMNVEEMHIDLLSCASHKMYGPKGIGALYIRSRNPRVAVVPQMDGAGHEHGIRSGTLNVPGIVGFGKAAQLAIQEMDEENQRIVSLRDLLQSELMKHEHVTVNGSREISSSEQSEHHVPRDQFRTADDIHERYCGLRRFCLYIGGDRRYTLFACAASDRLGCSSRFIDGPVRTRTIHNGGRGPVHSSKGPFLNCTERTLNRRYPMNIKFKKSQYIIGNQVEFLNYMKTRAQLIHLSNIFFGTFTSR
jgi:hypothetical protein